VHILADLWTAPAAGFMLGCSTAGSSEAAMLGGLALKWRRHKRQSEGNPAGQPIWCAGRCRSAGRSSPGSSTWSCGQVPLEPGATGLRPSQLGQYVDENTISMVAILGVTYIRGEAQSQLHNEGVLPGACKSRR
jgi:glutamate decarboxylase